MPQEREILEGFVWKPGDRPTSKEDLLSRKRVIEQEIIRADETDSALDSAATGGRPTDGAFQDLPSDPNDQVTGMTTNGEQDSDAEADKIQDAVAEATGESGEKKIEPAEFVPLGTTATDLHGLQVKELKRSKEPIPLM